MAHQYVEQMEEEVRDAVFGNVGTTVSFRVGPLDAELLEKVFVPTFTQEDIVNLGTISDLPNSYDRWRRVKTFLCYVTMGPLPKNPISYREEVIDTSRKNFSKPREEVQKYIDEWYKMEFHTEKQKKEIGKKEEYLKEKFGGEYKPRSSRPDDEYSGAFPDAEPAKEEVKKTEYQKIPNMEKRSHQNQTLKSRILKVIKNQIIQKRNSGNQKTKNLQ
jgi:hypothetical protein